MEVIRNGRLIPYAVQGIYDAVSYSWGSGTPLTRIDIFDRADQTLKIGAIPVKPNLESALRTFRKDVSHDEEQFFWIDAICINQDDEGEKGLQIEKMTLIYNLAREVRVWLGPATGQSNEAMEFVHKLNDLNDIDRLSNDTSSDSKWDAFRELMRSDWFNRRWIIQEIALARTARVYCGQKSIPWLEFTYAVSLFVQKAPDLKRLFQQSKRCEYNPDYLGELDALGAKVLVDITSNLVRKKDDGEVIDYLLSLEALMSTLTVFEAPKPHDTVYAILSLAHDAVAQSNRRHNLVIHTPAVTPHQSPRGSMSRSMGQHPANQPPSFVFDTAKLTTSPVVEEFSHKSSSEDQPTTHLKQPASQEQLVPPSSPAAFLKPPPTTQTGRTRSNSNTRQSLLEAEKDVRKEPNPIRVNYNQPVFDVCREFLEFTIRSSKSLDIICRPWAPSEEDMPSWIPPVTRKPWGLVSAERVYNRAAADSLVGAPGTGSQNYNAAGKTRAYRTDRPQESLIVGRTLVTRGLLLDIIAHEAPQAVEGVIPSKWPLLAGWHDTGIAPPPKFWRTMIADRDIGGHQQPPAHFAKACQWAFSRRAPFPMSPKDLLNQRSCPSVAVPFLRRVQAVTWDRKLVLTAGTTTTEPLLALVPPEATRDDLICVLHGCSVPVVLRKRELHEKSPFQTKSKTAKTEPYEGSLLKRRAKTQPFSDTSQQFASTNIIPSDSTTPRLGLQKAPSAPNTASLITTEPQYVFIGECYVDGMMAGEGFKHAEDAGHVRKEYHLV